MSDWHKLLLTPTPPDEALMTDFPPAYQAYLAWLLAQAEIPHSYRAHPFADADELAAVKIAVNDALGMSLGQLIRLLRVNRLLCSRAPAAVNWQFGHIDTPLGVMIAMFSERGLCLLEFADRKMLPRELGSLLALEKKRGIVSADAAVLAPLQQQLNEYFSGQRQAFSLPLDMLGTDFQCAVWRVLQTIPYGETRSYKAQAEALGRPSAVRAVANANGQNKISIIIPCHRVIGADGSLTGYGGGLPRKRYLLDLEKQNTRIS